MINHFKINISLKKTCIKFRHSVIQYNYRWKSCV